MARRSKKEYDGPRRQIDRPEGEHRRTSPLGGEAIAFLVLAGVAMGLGVGYLLDWLIGTLPLFTIIGVFAGFGLGLYAVYLDTK